MKEQIQLSDHFSYGRLIKFVIPSVVMMIFISIYGVVDGLFVSNFCGKNALTAVNIIFPLMMILGGFGFMLGTGGTAIVAKTLGMGDKQRANEYFTFITAVTGILGAVLAAVAIIFAEPIIAIFQKHPDVITDFLRVVFYILSEGDQTRQRGDQRSDTADIYTHQQIGIIVRELRQKDG